MQQANEPNSNKDPQLWAIAKKRAAFKRSLVTYLIVNAFLWIIWLLTTKGRYSGGIPWPVWPMAGWGIGMLFQYFDAFKYPKENSAEKEYDKLKRKQS